jgi:hypothetical protein
MSNNRSDGYRGESGFVLDEPILEKLSKRVSPSTGHERRKPMSRAAMVRYFAALTEEEAGPQLTELLCERDASAAV